MDRDLREKLRNGLVHQREHAMCSIGRPADALTVERLLIGRESHEERLINRSLPGLASEMVGRVGIDGLLLDLDEEQVLAAPKNRDVAGPWIVDATELDVVVRKVKDGRDERLATPPALRVRADELLSDAHEQAETGEAGCLEVRLCGPKLSGELLPDPR